jgi:hypothetical protein
LNQAQKSPSRTVVPEGLSHFIVLRPTFVV